MIRHPETARIVNEDRRRFPHLGLARSRITGDEIRLPQHRGGGGAVAQRRDVGELQDTVVAILRHPEVVCRIDVDPVRARHDGLRNGLRKFRVVGAEIWPAEDEIGRRAELRQVRGILIHQDAVVVVIRHPEPPQVVDVDAEGVAEGRFGRALGR